MALAGILSTLSGALFWRVTQCIGVQFRNCLITAIYQKSLRLSPKARQDRSTGQIVNLMSTDASKIDVCLGWCQTLPACLIQIIIAVGLLLNTIGLPSLAGVAVVVLLIPIQGKIVKVLQSIRRKTVLWTDRRVKLSNEILQGMRVIKLYNWEKSFLENLTRIRTDEMNLVRRGGYVRAFAVTVAQLGPILMSLLAFIVLAISGGKLTPEDVFASLVLFNLLRFPLMQLPFVGGMLADALVSKKRIEEFLLAEELYDQAEHVQNSQYAVEIENGEFTWEAIVQDKEDLESQAKAKRSRAEKKATNESSLWSTLARTFRTDKSYRNKVTDKDGKVGLLSEEKKHSNSSSLSTSTSSEFVIPSALRDVNVRISKGSLTMIVGAVGAGKTSLLSGILGEIKSKRGKVKLCGSVAYCAQNAWIQNCSLKNNVLFGLPFNPSRYQDVIRVCELPRDIEILPAGDETEIGEKGVNLSGGQKQRVSLARAVYFNADILLLDDVFSALDMHVGASIFKQCLLGLMKGKTRVLVTHQLQYVQYADKVLFVKDGCVAEQGSFEELMRNEGEFYRLMSDFAGGQDEPEDEQFENEKDLGSLTTSATTDLSAGIMNGHAVGVDEEKYSVSYLKQAILPTFDVTDQKEHPTLDKALSNGHRSRPLSRRSSATQENDSETVKKAMLLKKKMGELMSIEERSTGSVAWDVYIYYAHSLGNNTVLMLLGLVILFSTGSKVATDVWLAAWSDNQLDLAPHQYELGYAGLGILQGLIVWLLTFLVAMLSASGAIYLHDRSFASVAHAPTSFFDTTPLGRIIHRFSKDQDTIDNTLSDSMRAVLLLAAQIVGSFVLMCVSTPLFIGPLVPMLYIYYRLQTTFRKTSREIKRLDSTTRSPLFAHFSETLTGLSTIRAYKRELVFQHENEQRVDNNMRAYYLTVICQRWLGTRLETLGSIVVFFAAVVIIFTTQYGSLSPGLAGLSLSYAMTISGTLVFLIRQSIEAEMAMNSVERSKYYAENIEQEKPSEMPRDKELIESKSWPTKGHVKFISASMRYRPELPLILRNVCFEVYGGERIGIVGRTGAGKSSLMSALYRLVELESGSIEIDGEITSNLGMSLLRRSIAIIPQDAVLFSGTVRSNLDPFGEHSDDQIWAVLENARLHAMVSRLEMKLEAPVSEGGDNFSQGERCQLCLARAMLKVNFEKSKVLILDEATASLDLETDALVQSSLRKDFHCTILTIAHRLITVIDYDRVMVLSAGEIVEFDSPLNLLNKENGAFRALVHDTGDANEAMLRQMAQQVHDERQQRQNS